MVNSKLFISIYVRLRRRDDFFFQCCDLSKRKKKDNFNFILLLSFFSGIQLNIVKFNLSSKKNPTKIKFKIEIFESNIINLTFRSSYVTWRKVSVELLVLLIIIIFHHLKFLWTCLAWDWEIIPSHKPGRN
jgi:hypothetical protein